MDPVSAFVDEFFIQPIINPAVPGYNLVNTLTYGIILLGLTFYVIYPALKKKGFVFDWAFLQTLIPYIIFATSLRVLEDQRILTRSANPLDAGFYIFTPGIWFLTFALVIIGIIIGKKMGKGNVAREKKISMIMGIILALPLVLFNVLNAHEWVAAAIVVAGTGIISAGVFWLGNKYAWKFLQNPLAKTAFIGQMLDTTATFVALELLSCGEQHVIPRLLFGAFGNESFFVVKIPLILGVLYLLDKEYAHGKEPDEKLLGFILLFISILGLATGGRDLFTILVGTCSP